MAQEEQNVLVLHDGGCVANLLGPPMSLNCLPLTVVSLHKQGKNDSTFVEAKHCFQYDVSKNKSMYEYMGC